MRMTNMIYNKGMLLIPAVQTYAWGKPGLSSQVAQLSSNSIPDFQATNDVNYAELWMGTHPKGPSRLSVSGQSLSEWIAAHPDCLGEKVRARFPTPGQLPFLFKVLSVNKSLSIQAHPNKKLAEQLHSVNPDKYPDANHKPEMAVALTEFEGLCGFRPRGQILNFFKTIPELRAVVGEPLVTEFETAASGDEVKRSLQSCFTAVMTCDLETMTNQLAALVKRVGSLDKSSPEFSSVEGELLLRLHSQFPGDVGCFVTYFLNHVFLHPGESMFLEANLPHAYLSGDCIECMACSDNVVRAGLTPKFKDVSTLCEMLDYTCKPADENKFEPKKSAEDSAVFVYDPPVPDFTVARILLPGNTKDYALKSVDSASIILVIEGSAGISPSQGAGEHALSVDKGSVLFVSANEELTVTVREDSSSLCLFRAYCQL